MYTLLSNQKPPKPDPKTTRKQYKICRKIAHKQYTICPKMAQIFDTVEIDTQLSAAIWPDKRKHSFLSVKKNHMNTKGCSKYSKHQFRELLVTKRYNPYASIASIRFNEAFIDITNKYRKDPENSVSYEGLTSLLVWKHCQGGIL